MGAGGWPWNGFRGHVGGRGGEGSAEPQSHCHSRLTRTGTHPGFSVLLPGVLGHWPCLNVKPWHSLAVVLVVWYCPRPHTCAVVHGEEHRHVQA